MAINPNQLNNLLHKPFDVVNSKNIASYILQLMGLNDFQFIYTQNTLKKITDTTKKGMFVDDTEFADRKSAFDILNNQYNINSKHQQIILPRLFVIKQYSRSNVIWLNKLGINYEDDQLINGFYPLGLDFVVCQGRFLVVISNQDNLRVLELNHAQELNSTQLEILSQWQALFTSESNKKLLHTHLWNSLNLESVNKKFYIDIIQNFANLKQHLTNNNHFDNNQAVIFTNRLIGRLLFCYFLIKKDFIPTEYLELDQQNDNEYYHNKLSQLFFAVLNTPINERSHTDRTTPYLNGGLFERKDTDIANVTFPDNYFSNLFAIFRKYNWTVDESLSNYEVMAIDPEMLGRIFENLLAEINVDNDGSSESARKAKGAFYTPRVIVDYMCKESLRQYLLTNSPEHSHNIINRLLDDSISYLTDQKRNWTDDIKPYKEQLINLLDKITVFDPACGSGAFPMGMLHLILHTYERLGDKQKPNQRKIKIIENSIFGADIEPNAIEISRLRAWLSIVVDEDKQDIEPLPNLDFKFVCCNSLIKLETKGQSNLADNIGTVEKLQELQHKYFRARTYKSKQDIRQQYHNLIEQSRSQNSLFGKSKYLEQIESYHPFDTKNVCEFYDNQFMFGIQDGFDVVIGNPPYIGARNSKKNGRTEQDKAYYYNNFKLAKYQVNLYPLFIEKGQSLLNKLGTFCFITPNNWLTINTNKDLRKFVLEQSNIKIINFYSKVFESASVDSCISMFSKDSKNKKVELYEWSDSLNLISRPLVDELLNQKDYIINIESFKDRQSLNIINKIENKSVALDTIVDIKAGLQAYELGKGTPPQTSELKENRKYHSREKIDSSYIKYFDGKDICRYYIGWSGEFLKYGKNLASPRNNFELFSTKRILVRQIPSKPPYCIHACLIEETALNDRNSMNIINFKQSPEAILGVLNSRLISYWFIHKFGKMQRGVFPQFKINELASFPVPKTLKLYSDELIEFVNQIIKAKQLGEDIGKLEKQIDQLVYALYDLTPEEIAIIESK